MRNLLSRAILGTAVICSACTKGKSTEANHSIIHPIYISEAVKHDSDDPAIWYNAEEPEKSLIIGTDKDSDGALYVFDLKGRIIDSLTVRNLKRPNNVDIAYGMKINGQSTDLVLTTERETHNLRIFSLPDMKPLDQGGIPMFEGETGDEYRDLMGIAIYEHQNGDFQAVVGRKNGPKDGTYLWQYRLTPTEEGVIQAEVIRKFGQYSGVKEIEAIAVDQELGFIYYSDEMVGVRKYHADPDKGNEELALFATEGFERDHEGISIYKQDDQNGYILVSDQQSNAFHIFPREGTESDPHHHPLLKKVTVAAQDSDGSDMVSLPINSQFASGLFVVMSTDKTFHYYRWEDIAGDDLTIKNPSSNITSLK